MKAATEQSATAGAGLLGGVSEAVHERVVGQEEAVDGLLVDADEITRRVLASVPAP